MKTEEAALKDEVKAYLKKLGAYFYMPVPAGYGKQTVDFLCCIRGRFVAIETKAKGKVPTPRQELCMREVIAAGGAAFWCDSVDGFLLNLAVWGLDGEMADDRFRSHPPGE